jgi:hypothetical protein
MAFGLAICGEIAQVRGVGFARCVRLTRFCEVAGLADGLGPFGREGRFGGVGKHALRRARTRGAAPDPGARSGSRQF